MEGKALTMQIFLNERSKLLPSNARNETFQNTNQIPYLNAKQINQKTKKKCQFKKKKEYQHAWGGYASFHGHAC